MFTDCLSGTRVLDLSQYIPGPFATRMLADLGARVAKVEPPSGDPMRRFMTGGRNDVSIHYREINAGKQVAFVDLKTAKGCETLAGLVAAADVLLESFRPGVMERLGFDRERLRQLNPGLVHCALSGFGQSGPYRGRAGHDLGYMALAGGLNATGTETAPVMTFPPVADHAGAMQAAVAILGALVRRGRTGEGAYLDVSLYEAALSWQAMGLNPVPGDGGRCERRTALLTGAAACYQIYTTGDGRFVALAALEEKFWRRFCEAVGRCGWIERQQEPLPQKALIAEVAGMFAQLTFAECLDLAGRVDCCLEPVLEHAEVPGHPQVLHRQMLTRSGDADPYTAVVFPGWMNGRPPVGRQPLQEVDASVLIEQWQGTTTDQALPIAGERF